MYKNQHFKLFYIFFKKNEIDEEDYIENLVLTSPKFISNVICLHADNSPACEKLKNKKVEKKDDENDEEGAKKGKKSAKKSKKDKDNDKELEEEAEKSTKVNLYSMRP